ncbi:VirD4-like conjugal transfer protein, CD1115 family [Paenibacillus sp. Soil522]|uniref:VirD4-like conjugal transfer protein, CD1115 family n=1 Tax=Paenibacillus sp. Soil522 TaxID=1736388 RepID=UPI0006FEE995|nr:type IV secretory system conjugative DNA transfer family protein [Paenibacillus sp. Soil522]KRE45498.1 hypothetical protein ASG81_12850 [Paenibacillus sp. Soil522]
MKWITIILLLLIDTLVVPSVVRLPKLFLTVKPASKVPRLWLEQFSLTDSWTLLLADPQSQKLFLVLQGFLLLLIFMIVLQGGKKNSIVGVGGPPAAGNGHYGSSRFQTMKELGKTTTHWPFGTMEQKVKGTMVPIKGGIVLGASLAKKFAWTITEDLHTLIIGITRSGKTRRTVLPTIWQLAYAGESMILTDPKSELFDLTSDYLKKMGYKIVYLDFRKPGRGNRWNPMAQVVSAIEKEDMAEAIQQAWSIANMFVYSKPGAEKGEPIWRNGAESVIAALILAVTMEAPNPKQKHMTSVYKMLAELGEPVKTPDGEEYVPINEYFKSLPRDHPARDALATARLAPEKMRGSFFSDVSALLRLFSDPSIAYLTGQQDHDLHQSGVEKTATYLIIPDEDKTRHSLAALYADQSYRALVELANQNKGRLPVRVNYLLDEFGNMPAIKDFDAKLTVSGGRGIRWHLIVQAFQQLKSIYPTTSDTIRGNCHTLIYLLTQDTETAKDISLKCGKYTIQTQNTSTTVRSHDTSSGTSTGLTGRDLLTIDEILRWPEDFSLVLRARQFPAKVPLPDLSYWPANQEFIPTGGEEPRLIERVPIHVPAVAAPKAAR